MQPPHLMHEDETTQTFLGQNGLPVVVAKKGLEGSVPAPFDPSILEQNAGAFPINPKEPSTTIQGADTLVQAKPVNPAAPPLGGGFGLQAKGIRDAAAIGEKKAAEDFGYLKAADEQASQMEALSILKDQDRQKFIGEENKKLQSARDAYLNQPDMDPDRLFKNMSTGNKILAGMSIFLGGIGDSMAGKKENGALQIINKAIDDDMIAQKADIEKKKGAVDVQSNILASMRSQFADERQAELAAKMMLLDGAKRKVELTSAKYAGDVEKAKAASLLGAIDNERGKYAMDFQKATADLQKTQADIQKTHADIGKINAEAGQAARGGDLKPTQWSAATFGRKMEQSESVLKQLDKDGFSAADYTSAAGGLLPNAANTEKRQKFEQAKRSFINSVLRDESGASIAPHEREEAEKQYFDQAGDSAQVREQKRLARQVTINAFKAEAGGAWDRISPALSQKEEAEAWLKKNPNDPQAADVRKALSQLNGK